MPTEALDALARLYTLGATKYAPRNWEKGMSYERVFNALNRHLWAWWNGERNDPVDGQNHMIAVAWNAFTLFMYELKGWGTDDRVITQPTKEREWCPDTAGGGDWIKTYDAMQRRDMNNPSGGSK